MKIIRITHYSEDDPGCIADYYDLELQDESGKVIAEFGDDYHDKGQEKAEGFILGLKYILGETVEVIEKQVADR